MEWIMDVLSEVILSVLGGTLTFIAAKLGKTLAYWYQEKFQNDALRSLAASLVRAVEQMYWDCKGEEKMEKALSMGETVLSEKGIKISAAQLRMLLEEALGEMKKEVLKS